MRRLSLALRRQLARGRGNVDGALLRCWEQSSPGPGSPPERVRFLVCDAETSGLDARDAELLSLGWVCIDDGEICLGSAAHHLLQARDGVGQSAAIHQLRDCELQGARPAQSVLREFLGVAAGRVLVFHHAALDLAFLDAACRSGFGAPLLLPAVDTLQLERRQWQRRDRHPGPGDLRLAACRERYGLVEHGAHNALEDALATAELLLAQLAASGAGLRLRDLF